ncbi:MAG: hypothetical protein ACK46X_18820 [Candidatus Sericytochromatia bacterium]
MTFFTPRRWLNAGIAISAPLWLLAGCSQSAVAPTAPAPPEGDVAAEAPAPSLFSIASTARAPRTTPITNIAGMNAAAYAPTVRSTFMDVTPDGRRVAIAWLVNRTNGVFSRTGEPITWATSGDPTVPSSFTTPKVIGRRTTGYAATATTYNKQYNADHNAPFVVGLPNGGFVGLANPMNANGYAQNLPATPYGYSQSVISPGYTTWAAPGMATLASMPAGSSLSEMSGNADSAGGVHLFGQGHRGQFQSGFGYQRRRPGTTTWESKTLASAYRTGSLNYFAEGGGYASRVKNAKGQYDIHAAFAWNRAGIKPIYGLSYLVSRDGGTTWQTAAGKAVTLPVTHADASAAVFPANLKSGTVGGSTPGHSTINVAATHDGAGLIVRPNEVGGSRVRVQHRLYTFHGGKWIHVPVGPELFWNANGNGVAYNAKTGRVNVVLLDPGSWAKPARVLLYHQSLADLRAGKAAWTEEVVASVPQKHYASSLIAREVKDTRFVVLFESEYKNPGTVQPVLLEAPMR